MSHEDARMTRRAVTRKDHRFGRVVTVLVNVFSAVAFFLASGRAMARVQNVSARPLRTLTTASEAHSLPAPEAVKGYPIHFEAVVTFTDRYMDPRQVVLFVHDGTRGMFVSVPKDARGSMPAGTVVDVQGVSAMGDFAPIILHPALRSTGRVRPLPVARPVSLTRLLSGEEDGQWVEAEGVVHSLFQDEHEITVQLAMRDGTVPVTIPREAGQSYGALVDARVRIRANAGPVFNKDKQMIGARLMCPDMANIRVIEAGPSDVFQLPIRHVADLFRFSSVTVLPRRVHVRGKVTLAWPGSLLCIRDATHGLCARTLEPTPVALGELVDVAGFAEIRDSVPSLSDAVFRSASSPDAVTLRPVAAKAVTVQQALNGGNDSELVQLEGQLIGRNAAAADTTLMLASGGGIYALLLPHSLSNEVSSAWKEGSQLRVTGICSVQIDEQRTAREGGAAKTKSFRLLMRSPADVVVLSQPSWWTPRHTVLVLTIVLTLTLTVLGWVVVLTKRLKQKTKVIGESEERFRHLAQHDFLTGLPTRGLLRDRLHAAMDAARNSDRCLALLMLDLDKFKHINDSLGHQAGDEALKITARRAVEVLGDADTVARISGDEFVVLLTELVDSKEGESIAAKLVAALSAPFRVGDHEVPLSVSVGICVASGGGLNAEALFKRADTALYHAKAGGRNRYQLYTSDLARASEQSSRFQATLENALQAQEMEVHFQPMVSFNTREVTGFEALVRWRSRELGLVMPSDFIPVAEQSGFIIPLGEWVLREACLQMGQLEQELGRKFVLAVNLSPRQIQQQHDLPERIAQVLADADRAPSLLELEITENILMNDSDSTRNTLLGLQTLGVRLAIDDFGVGFSSLSYITRFAIDRIKIDRSFVRKALHESGSLAVVRAMVAMAHGLAIQVVAEGVETEAEFNFLCEEGCDTAQGFYISGPVPAQDVVSLVSREYGSVGAACQ